MENGRLSSKLVVILHADVAGSTSLVRQDEQLTHARIQDTFHRFSNTINNYHGRVHELRGDALLAEFDRASDAVASALAFQSSQSDFNAQISDAIKPEVRVGVALGEVVIADDTITGAGVVLAQRLEQLAEPAGVVIQGAIFETIPERFPFEYDNLGEHQIKGFDDSVKAYRVRLSEGKSIPAPQVGKKHEKSVNSRNRNIGVAIIVLIAALATAFWFRPWEPVGPMAFQLPDKPSIAVLPLINMSDDKSQDYFADGMTEDLITDLSKISGLFVIARTSSFYYKGKQVKVSQVAEEMGVRYVLEGSVRRAGDQIRINAQLIDATTGGHLWAERYDGALTDVFGLQDKVVTQIVNALAVNLTPTEIAAAGEVETSNPAAYDAVLQGWQFARKRSPQDFAKAITYFEKAIEIDPDYRRAYASLASVYWSLHDLSWQSEIGLNYQALDLARQNLALALKQPSAEAYRVSARMKVVLGNKNEALQEINRALELEPNEASVLGTRAWVLLVSGQAVEAEKDARRAVRLDPAALWNIEALARALFHQERYEESIVYFEKVVNDQPDYEHHWRQLAMTYAYLGRLEEARTAIQNYNALAGNDLTLQGYESLYADQYDFDRSYLAQMIEGLRLAGVPAGTSDEPSEVNFRSRVTKFEGSFDVRGAIEINAAGAKTLHDRGAVFIDSRGARQYGYGHIPGATNLYFGEEFTKENLSRLAESDDEVVFYCGGPDCHLSANSCAQALNWGYTKVYYFAGGFPAWIGADYPVEDS